MTRLRCHPPPPTASTSRLSRQHSRGRPSARHTTPAGALVERGSEWGFGARASTPPLTCTLDPPPWLAAATAIRCTARHAVGPRTPHSRSTPRVAPSTGRSGRGVWGRRQRGGTALGPGRGELFAASRPSGAGIVSMPGIHRVWEGARGWMAAWDAATRYIGHHRPGRTGGGGGSGVPQREGRDLHVCPGRPPPTLARQGDHRQHHQRRGRLHPPLKHTKLKTKHPGRGSTPPACPRTGVWWGATTSRMYWVLFFFAHCGAAPAPRGEEFCATAAQQRDPQLSPEVLGVGASASAEEKAAVKKKPPLP